MGKEMDRRAAEAKFERACKEFRENPAVETAHAFLRVSGVSVREQEWETRALDAEAELVRIKHFFKELLDD